MFDMTSNQTKPFFFLLDRLPNKNKVPLCPPMAGVREKK